MTLTALFNNSVVPPHRSVHPAKANLRRNHLTKFWVNHNALKGKAFDARGVHGPDRAADALEKAAEADTASGSRFHG